MFLSEAASWQSRNMVQRKPVIGLHMYQGRIDNFCRLRISKLAVYFLAVLRISISLSYRSGQSAKFGTGSHHLQMKRASTFRASRKCETDFTQSLKTVFLQSGIKEIISLNVFCSWWKKIWKILVQPGMKVSLWSQPAVRRKSKQPGTRQWLVLKGLWKLYQT